MKTKQARQLTKDAAPTCSAADGCSDRYRVWLGGTREVVKARTKKELFEQLKTKSL